tara:strand:+ start:910 stop:1782 length:873 start_codon:yes stop_codon:yes gene_type:complete
MNFEFSKTLQGFVATHSDVVEVSNVKFQGEAALYCNCKESADQIGVTRIISLANLSEYILKITGKANNNRTYISVTDGEHGRDLTKEGEKIYFPRNKEQTISVKFYGNVHNIRISILMGGDSIAVRGNSFLIFKIRLIPVTSNSEKEHIIFSSHTENSEGLKITRTFETVAELDMEKIDPLRSNQTPMEIGEYAILRGEKQDDLYVLSSRAGLKYVSRIGQTRPTILAQPMHVPPGREMPIFKNELEAKEKLKQDPDKFYFPMEITNSSKKNPDIYLYLAKDGTVRWLSF